MCLANACAVEHQGYSWPAVARVGNKMELWDILVQVQLCHPLDPVGGNTSIGVTVDLVFSWFCLIQFDLAVCLNRNTNLVSPL